MKSFLVGWIYPPTRPTTPSSRSWSLLWKDLKALMEWTKLQSNYFLSYFNLVAVILLTMIIETTLPWTGHDILF